MYYYDTVGPGHSRGPARGGDFAGAALDAHTDDGSTARGWAKPTTRVFSYILVYTVASIDTQCTTRIDSNLESGRYIGLEGFSLYSGSRMGYRSCIMGLSSRSERVWMKCL